MRLAQRLSRDPVAASAHMAGLVLASLSMKAPQRAIHIAVKALAYVQRTQGTLLTKGQLIGGHRKGTL